MLNSNLLVLRNKTSLKHTKEFFSNNNINCFYQEISISNSVNIDLTGIKTDIVLITSQNALDALLNNINKFNFNKIYCLNSDIAEKVKVKNIVALNWQNTKQLAKYILNNEKSGQKIIHLCADNANKLFYKELKSAGFNIEAINAYKTNFVKSFSDEVLEALKQNKIKYVMIFSKQSLIAAEKIFAKNNLNLNNYKLICFSENIAKGKSELFSKNSTLQDMLQIYEELSNG